MVKTRNEPAHEAPPVLLPGGVLIRTAFALVLDGEYSCSGIIVAAGEGATDFQAGDWVAFSSPQASPIQSIAKNLCVKVSPSSFGLEPATFIAAGARALQAVREAGVRLGEAAAVLGTGPIAPLARQLLQSAGCRVIERAPVAKEPFPDLADAVILTSAIREDELLHAAQFCRQCARFVCLGSGDLPSVPQIFREKQIGLHFSRDVGPGRFDPQYEQLGVDYPIGYVRWTAKRNMEAVRDLIAGGKLDLSNLVPARCDAVRLSETPAPGVLLDYNLPVPVPAATAAFGQLRGKPHTGIVRLGVIGQLDKQALAALARMELIDMRAIPAHLDFDTSIDAIAIAGDMDAQALESIRQAASARSLPLTYFGLSRQFAPATLAIRSFFERSTEPMVVQYRVSTRGARTGEAGNLVDLITYLIRAQPTEVFARNIGGGDNLHAQIRYSNGSLGTLQYLVNGSAPCDERIEAFGGGATAIVENFRRITTSRDGKIRKNGRRFAQPDKGAAAQIHAFLSAIRQGGFPPAPLEQAIAAAHLWARIFESLHSGSPVKL